MRLCSLDREHAYVRAEQKRTQKPPQQDSPHSLLSFFFPDFLLVLSPFSTLLSISSSFPSFCIHTWFCHWHVLICVSVIYIYIFSVQLVLVLCVSSFFGCGLIVSYFFGSFSVSSRFLVRVPEYYILFIFGIRVSESFFR